MVATRKRRIEGHTENKNLSPVPMNGGGGVVTPFSDSSSFLVLIPIFRRYHFTFGSWSSIWRYYKSFGVTHIWQRIDRKVDSRLRVSTISWVTEAFSSIQNLRLFNSFFGGFIFIFRLWFSWSCETETQWGDLSFLLLLPPSDCQEGYRKGYRKEWFLIKRIWIWYQTKCQIIITIQIVIVCCGLQIWM